jgi:hypothetical protein
MTVFQATPLYILNDLGLPELGCGGMEKLALVTLLGELPGEIMAYYEKEGFMKGSYQANYLGMSERDKEWIKKSTFYRGIAETMEAELACTKLMLTDMGKDGIFNDVEINKALTFVNFASIFCQPSIPCLLPEPLEVFKISRFPEQANIAQDPDADFRLFRELKELKTDEEKYIDIGSMSNVETMLRFGFEIPQNQVIARQFDLVGEPAQAYCPSVSIRRDAEAIVPEYIIACHVKARLIAGTGTTNEEQETRNVKQGIGSACKALLDLTSISDPGLTNLRMFGLLKEEERVLIRCILNFTSK